jgi:zinc transport system substrate-binding protein
VGSIPLLLVLLVALAACGTADDAAPAAQADEPAAAGGDDPPAGEAGEGVSAVATVFPLAWMAEGVAPGADVAFLAARGQDPHDLELSPADRVDLEDADVLLYMGDLGFQPQVESAVDDAAGEVVDVADVAGEARLKSFSHAHDDDGHAHDDDDPNDGYDPHLWLDAEVMADVAERMGEAFAAADPDGAESYRANAERLREELLTVDEELDEMLTGCELETAIVSHEAYAYLLEPRGLEQEGISGAGGHSEASPQRLAELAQRIEEQGIPLVLAEPVEGRADAEALAAEAGVPIGEIDPLEVAPEDRSETGFVELLREQAQTFAEALRCV